ncbi:transcriptional regulator family: Fungal Specific TF [Paecilomyces variotii]|nr:transcriptional regulator family: Fungal Specific TF [Paecilomyces variotii]
MASAVSSHLADFDIPLDIAAPTAAAAEAASLASTSDDVSGPRKSGRDFDTQLQTRALNADQRPSPRSSSSQSPHHASKPQRDTVKEAQKPRRVRTGCLTCRERHLKCDEALPRCQNCQKSDRLCKRGIRLNFIDTQTVAPPFNIAHPPGTQLAFQDESREIASEYKGGFERYPPLKQDPLLEKDDSPSFDFDILSAPTLARRSLPVTPSLLSTYSEPHQTDISEHIFHDGSYSAPQPAFADHTMPHPSFNMPKMSMMQSSGGRTYLNSAEEVLLMQVFVEEVGLWMDSMDVNKHFSHILPFHALGEPMLLNAFMACGARHLYLVNPSYGEDKALHYYNIVSRQLLTCLQDPDRDTVLCATTAVILNVYEVMCEKAMQRMNHIAGARALIKECRWDAKTPGIGGACFWLNVGMELLSCLHFNWKMAWDPDTWGVDMNMSLVPGGITGDEELWTHRIVYICAKIANFRSSVPQFQGPDRVAHDIRISQRCQEWNTYKSWCDEWAKNVPRSMMPLGYLQPWQTNSKSSFPEVWLIKRSAVVARLFYHTACTLLAKVHPTESEFSPEMRNMQQSHAHDICGIVAHVKDRGVASVSIRCLAIAAECLVGREAQEEVLEILDKIIKETGWRVGFLKSELQEKWGWIPSSNTPGGNSLTAGSLLNSAMPPMTRPRIPSGIVNPLMATADFSMENHPYQNHYVAPHNHLDHYQYTY